MKYVMGLLLVVMVVGCQKKSEDYTYDYTENQCPTGSHNFSSKEELCAALKNDAANNFCAHEMRAERYNQDCGGGMKLYGSPQVFDANEMVASHGYDYELVGTNCSTGAHHFASKTEYCKGLLDEGLNGGCAFDVRVEKSLKECLK